MQQKFNFFGTPFQVIETGAGRNRGVHTFRNLSHICRLVPEFIILYSAQFSSVWALSQQCLKFKIYPNNRTINNYCCQIGRLFILQDLILYIFICCNFSSINIIKIHHPNHHHQFQLSKLVLFQRYLKCPTCSRLVSVSWLQFSLLK